MSTLELRLTPYRAVLILRGEVDIASYATLRRRLLELLDHPAVLQVDASSVTTIDCTCLSLIERARRQLGRDGRLFDVVGASPIFARVCALIGYEDLARTAHGVIRPG